MGFLNFSATLGFDVNSCYWLLLSSVVLLMSFFMLLPIRSVRFHCSGVIGIAAVAVCYLLFTAVVVGVAAAAAAAVPP